MSVLARQQWAAFEDGGVVVSDAGDHINERVGGILFVEQNQTDGVNIGPGRRQVLAALALHRQPSGFTAADLAALDWAAQWAGRILHERQQRDLLDLRRRLGDLLPPWERP